MSISIYLFKFIYLILLQALEQLCRGLASNKSLQKLDLECKGITHVGCTHLAAALTSNTTLNELVLSRNDIRAEGVTALVADNSLANVRVLHLSGCSLDNIHASKAASELLLTTPDLEALHYQNNSLESDTAIEAWASGLKSCTKLRKLVLTSTKINVTEVDAFASSIPSSIQYMDLSNTALGASGIEAIAQSQTNNGNYANLETLILCDSGADSAALAPLANTLNALAVLDIGGHDLYDRNDALEALASSPSLVSLRLHNCKLGDQGIARIGDLATSNSAFTSLKDLDISFNAINQEALISFLKVLIDAATAFEQLNMLIVAGNPGLESDDVDEIVSELGQARPHLMVVRRNADTGERDN